ncbi:MAG: GlxA family transcriptional regulator [Pikeienuella sp.]
MNGVAPFQIVIVATPGFNLAASTSFLDPFRAANYLDGVRRFTWGIYGIQTGNCSEQLTASNGLSVLAEPLSDAPEKPDLVIVSSSWTPEAYYGAPLDGALRRWARFGAVVGGLDTGAFILAAAGLLNGRRATVHYEHTDAFIETFPKVTVTEDLLTLRGDRVTAAGGQASSDLALHILNRVAGPALANAAARYVFHDRLRPDGERQAPDHAEPLGADAPTAIRQAIKLMEAHLEEVMSAPGIASAVGLSLRQLERLFQRYVGKPPQRYYTDIRLDRARGLVRQTQMSLKEISLACGFASQEHFSRAYRTRFGASARQDRKDGTTPFEYRAWPMHESGANR